MNDNRFAVFLYLFNADAPAHDNRPAPCRYRRPRARRPQYEPSGREIRPRYNLQQISIGNIIIVNERETPVHHLAQIVRRHIGRHADSNAIGTIDKQVRKPRRQNNRLALGIIIIVLEINRILVDIVKKCVRGLCHANFRITHGGGWVAVYRTEVALPVKQWQAHGKILSHAYQCVVNRLVSMRVIFTDNIAHYAG